MIMAEATTVDESKISIKVIVDKEKKRVVYAEANYTFVDILFSFMTLPLGTIVRLLGKQADKKFEALGSLNNLYQSLVDFPELYLSSEECKSVLLNPRSPAYDRCRSLKLKIDDTEPIKYYVCLYFCYNNRFGCQFSTFNTARCDQCGGLMSQEVSMNDSTIFGDCAGGVFVSDIATFIVTDDLCVMPYTLGGSIQLLKDNGITETSCLQERKLDIGREQMLYLLKLGLSLNSPLTYLVFPEGLVCVEQAGSFDKCSLIKEEVFKRSKMTLEVSMQTSTGKLLFAEAKEDFVDFVFGFLAIPLGTLVGTLLNGASSLVCMDNLFKSISNMNVGSYLKSQDIKDILLKPSYGQHYTSENQVFPLESTVITIRHDGANAILKDPRSDGGLLKRPGMFMVTDDLVITPSSSLSLIDALNKLNVPFNDIEKHEISIGLEEGLKLLQASLKVRSTLTNSLKNQLKK